jgi:hypothetical protein
MSIKYFLIERCLYEEPKYYAFESEKTLEQLEKEFSDKYKNFGSRIDFYGLDLHVYEPINFWSIETLEGFWQIIKK